jgi:hypothetical protein
VFHRRYFSSYESGQCGQNIMGLLDEARALGVDVTSARMLKITNEGNSVFGMVNAEQARGRRHVRTGAQLPVWENNWYHHVVLEMDCQVYDFDYLNAPTVTPLPEYLESMFLRELATGNIRVGREIKLQEYRVNVYPAPEYYSNTSRKTCCDKPIGSISVCTGYNYQQVCLG